jgi:hypothetical protein
MKTNDRDDSFQIEFFSKTNPLDRGIEAVQKIVEGMVETAGEFAPDNIRFSKAPRKYSAAELQRVLSAQKSSVKPYFTLTRSSPPDVYYTLSFLGKHVPLGFTFAMETPLSTFTVDKAEPRAHSIVAMVKFLAGACTPTYAYGHSQADQSLSDDPRKESSLVPNKIYEMYWLNLLGPEMVAEIGRERVLSTPCFRVEELSGGSVLLLTAPTPAGYESPEARKIQARALAHIVDGVNEQDYLARLMERSRRLAPVKPDWDPDIRDLLDLTLADVPHAERPSKIAELNRYRPPEVSEWRPLDQLLEADVGDIEETVDSYGIFAEKLVALLHTEIPSVMEPKPESLPLIDYHFWHFEYPSEFKREDIEEDLVPAIGAYLGDVIIRNLGGRWVPRSKLDESQLVAGDRVWLPFLRARHYMQSVQSVLDYSLTKFYRVVERHVRG